MPKLYKTKQNKNKFDFPLRNSSPRKVSFIVTWQQETYWWTRKIWWKSAILVSRVTRTTTKFTLTGRVVVCPSSGCQLKPSTNWHFLLPAMCEYANCSVTWLPVNSVVVWSKNRTCNWAKLNYMTSEPNKYLKSHIIIKHT